MRPLMIVSAVIAIFGNACAQKDDKKSDKMENFEIQKSDAEWRGQLTTEQYIISRKKGTERPFTGKYYKNDEPGVYKCICCGNELFVSETKYESGSGWPSFYKPVNRENVLEERDVSYGMVRTEVMCRKCGAHLGHVFNDGPKPTGLRYCINSASLDFEKSKEKK